MQQTTSLGHWIEEVHQIFFVEKSNSNTPKVPRVKFMGRNVLFYFISIRKFGGLNNPFATITRLSEFNFRIRKLILLVQMKKVISMNYGSSTRSWKPWGWVRLNLIFFMRKKYINSNLTSPTKFTKSSRSTEFKDLLPWTLSQMIRKTVPISTRIVISYLMQSGIPMWIWGEDNRNWDNNIIRNSQWKESHCRTNTSIRINK